MENQTKKFRTHYNYRKRKADIEHPVGTSETLPDQNYTIREILQKFSSGISPSIAKVPIYDDNPEFDNYDPTRDLDFDLTDAVRLELDINEKQTAINNKIAEKEALKKEAEIQKQLEFDHWKKTQEEKANLEKKGGDKKEE